MPAALEAPIGRLLADAAMEPVPRPSSVEAKRLGPVHS